MYFITHLIGILKNHSLAHYGKFGNTVAIYWTIIHKEGKVVTHIVPTLLNFALWLVRWAEHYGFYDTRVNMNYINILKMQSSIVP